MGFDDLLKFANSLSGSLELDVLLKDAKDIYIRLNQAHPHYTRIN